MVEEALLFSNHDDLIINLSYDLLPISKTLISKVPIAHLISMGNESFAIVKEIEKVYLKHPRNFAFHTKKQATDFPFIKDPIVVGNGFNLSNYNFCNKKKGPLGWVGRVSPEKGLEDAVYVANKLKEKLNIWGFVEDKKYALMLEEIDLGGVISWRGFLKTSELQKELGECRALINTPKWNEAYGNVVVEALACGVPVVAYKRGGPSEIIKHGITGFLTEPDDKEELLKYLIKVDSIDRSNCRSWVINNASLEAFANKIDNWLEEIIDFNR